MATKSYERALTPQGFVWSLPVSLLGLAAALCSLPSVRIKGGMLVCRSDRGFARMFLSRRGFAALTLGRVVTVTKEMSLQLWNHEREHARQAEVWGIAYVPVYLFHHFRVGYRNNPFEETARRVGDDFAEDHPEAAGQALG